MPGLRKSSSKVLLLASQDLPADRLAKVGLSAARRLRRPFFCQPHPSEETAGDAESADRLRWMRSKLGISGPAVIAAKASNSDEAAVYAPCASVFVVGLSARILDGASSATSDFSVAVDEVGQEAAVDIIVDAWSRWRERPVRGSLRQGPTTSVS